MILPVLPKKGISIDLILLFYLCVFDGGGNFCNYGKKST